jgi:hypothetical protein
MWTVGERVFGQKGAEQFWYTGTVRHIDRERCYVIYDDGDDALVEPNKLKALNLQTGDRVFARLPMDGDFKPATVVAPDHDKVRVRWMNGEEDWTSVGMIRLQPDLPGQIAGKSAEPAWNQGDRVFACWHDLFWYPGVVVAVAGEEYHVLFDTGTQAMVQADRIKPLQFEIGDRVFSRWKGGPEFYSGEITRRDGEVIHINYDDGDEETTTVRLIRLQRDDWFPPSEIGNVHEGDRVLGCWFDSHWYPGLVLSVEGKRLHVLFDDGDQAMLTPDKVRTLEINVGDRIWCRKKGGPAYYPAEVVRKQGEMIQIHYEDGDDEKTSIRLVRINSDSGAGMEQQNT